MNELQSLREVNFDWTYSLKSVWADSFCDVPALHEPLRKEIVEEMLRMKADSSKRTPLGRVVVGLAGSGKTHLLSAIQSEAVRNGCWFVLADMTDVHNFMETVLLGFLDSLQTPYDSGRLQYQVLLHDLMAQIQVKVPLERLASVPESKYPSVVGEIVNKLRMKYPVEMFRHQDIVRALLLFHSQDNTVADVGYSFLMSIELDSEDKRKYNFRAPAKKPIEIIESLAWLMGLHRPTVLALDQLDAIVSQHHLASGSGDGVLLTDEQKKSLAIIEGIGRGLSDLWSRAPRSLILVSCLLLTWDILVKKALRSDTDRYREPTELPDIMHSQISQQLVELRLNEAYNRIGFRPPYPTYPFLPEAFATAVGITPREMLKRCDKIRNQMLQQGAVKGISTFSQDGQRPAPSRVAVSWDDLDRTFTEWKTSSNLAECLQEEQEDGTLKSWVQNAFRCLMKENPTSDSVDPHLDTEFPSGKNVPPLHTRFRLVYREENDREEHYCLRVLQRKNAIAFQNRLSAALVASGIDRDLRFRRLVLVRSLETPGGAKTNQLLEQFKNQGGVFLQPTEEDWRTLYALHKMAEQNNPRLDEWVKEKRPLSHLSLFQDWINWFEERTKEKPATPQKPLEPSTQDQNPPVPSVALVSPSANARIHIGYRLIGEKTDEELWIPADLLSKHTVILAGSGSGKTVLVRRMVEEAALQGIPSIVVDAANDLARLGDPWPERPVSWEEGDIRKADDYFKQVEVCVWTPGRDKGNPLRLDPLPDFSSLKEDPDELEQAISMTRESLKEIVASGSSASSFNKMGVLSAALKHFVKLGRKGLPDLVELLSDLPSEAGGGISKAGKLAMEMADQIRAAMEVNSLLKPSGTALNPSVLLGLEGCPCRRTRISVISFVGLPGLESQQQFLNQLAMTLFTWIKKNPSPAGQPLRGLLVIDEAKDFIPSASAAVCKASLIRLAAQARKYGLGLIVATQAPKSIDHNIIANCSTQIYGKTNSPTAIETVQELIRQKGGTGHDISRLEAGRFYLFSEKVNGEKIPAPIKFQSPLCLSYHPNSPLEEGEVLKRAETSRVLSVIGT